jgi:hypothetical protein
LVLLGCGVLKCCGDTILRKKFSSPGGGGIDDGHQINWYRSAGGVIEPLTIEQFPFLGEKVRIYSMHAKLAIGGFAKDVICRFLEIVMSEEYGDRYMDAG